MRTTKKRLLSALLTLCMVLTLLPMTAIPAYAANPVASKVTLTTSEGAQELDGTYKYLVNNKRATTGTLGSSGCTAYFDSTNGTLTLHNYTGGEIISGSTSVQDLTVKLVGTNTIDNRLWNEGGGDILITADSVATLSITRNGNSGQILAGISTKVGGGTTDPGSITIGGKANITISVTNTDTGDFAEAYGIYAKQDILIEGDASLDITCVAHSKIASTATGIYTENQKITFNTTGTITVDCSNSTNLKSRPLRSYGNILTEVGEMTLKYTEGGGNNRLVNFNTGAFVKSKPNPTTETYGPGPMTVNLTPGNGKVTLNQASSEPSYEFVYTTSDTSVSAPDSGTVLSEGVTKVSAGGSVDISAPNGKPIYVQVYKRDGGAHKVYGFGEASATPNSSGVLTFTDSASYDVPAGTVSTAISPIDVSGGVSGGTTPYTFSKVSGPDWLEVSATGIISGTRPATTAEATTADIKVTDSASASQTITIAVGAVTAAPVTVTGVTVKTNPTKITYTEGETLNLAGLEVTLNKSGGPSEDVAFANFGANGLTTSPAQGDTLATTHNKVTVTHTDGPSVDVTITVTPAAPTITGVSVSPSTTSVQKGKTETFSATVEGTGSYSHDVTWSVSGAVHSGTAIGASTGVLTVDAEESATTLTVTATSNGGGSIEGTATVTVTDVAVTKYILTVEGGTGGGEYAENAVVNIAATVPGGKVFKQWESSGGGTFASATSANTTFTMPAEAVTVKAIFEAAPPTTYSVTVQNDGHGTASASPTSAEAGATITLSASPNSGYVFKEWQVVSGGVTVSDNKFTMPAEAVTVNAIFEALAPDTVATPVFSPNGGSFTDSRSVSITCATEGATIRYTTDGSDPVSSSPTYSGALTLTETTTVKAIAFKVGMTDSAIATATFTKTSGGSGSSDPESDDSDSSAGGSGSSGAAAGSGTAATPDYATQAAANTAAATAAAQGSDHALVRSTGVYGVPASVWSAFAGYEYWHDTMDGNAVQVRTYIKNPAAITTDLLVSGYVKGAEVEATKALFEKYFGNQVSTIHLDQTGAWGQTVELAAKADLTGMDVAKLHLYSYDKATNTYRRIERPAYWVDRNGYLHFNTAFAGDIIISEGPLTLKENEDAKQK